MAFIFKKIVTPFLLPPGLFVTLLILAGAVLGIRGRRKSGLVCVLLGLFLWVLSIPPVFDAFLRPLESAYPVPRKPVGDVIVMLCGGAHHGAPDLTGTGAPSGSTLERMVTAARLQRMLDLPLIISGGRVWDSTASEASIVRRFLTDMGLPARKLIVEGESRDTFENAQLTAVICAERGFRRPILVTAALHLPRAVWCFQKAGLQVLPFPAAVTAYPGKRYTWAHYLPAGYEGLASALHEYLGLAYYRLTDRFGAGGIGR